MDFIALIQHQAEAVFGSKEKAEAWLTQPKTALGDRSPLELVDDEDGCQLVMDALERINHGYSS